MKITNLLSKIFISIALLGLVSCGKKLSLRDGTFTGVGEGKNGPIEVSITVQEGRVTNATLLSSNETPELAEPVYNQIFSQFLSDGTGSTSEIDTVSGATITSNGLLDALDDAIKSAEGEVKTEEKYEDSEVDIVIIGAGGAGLTAATEAASKGAKVLVLEKMGIVGGNSNFSTGGINASYTKEQKRLGITDSKEVFFEDTMKGGQYLNDKDLVHTLVDKSAEIVEWLQSPMIGADLSDVGMFGGATNKRIHRPKGGAAIGSHLVPLLHKAALEQGAEIRVNNRVIDILDDGSASLGDGRAVGVRVSYSGGEYTVKAKAVIIATGGFGANPELITRYQASLEGFGTTNHKGATGDAFKMVEKFDAELTQMEQIQVHPTVVKGTGIMITEAVRGNGAILINRSGRRFINEMETRDIVSAAVLQQSGKTAFLVFDQSIRESLKAIETYIKQGFVKQGETIREMSDNFGIDGVALEYTVEQYNKYVDQKKDEEFSRNPASMDRKIEKGPFYAIEIEPAIHHTMGGLKINTKAQVLNKSGKPIPGLFAAGEVTGGVHGAERLGGNAVADITIFGKIAADSALEYIK
ncbi:MAG: flavocytochrome c [Treponema sp.]|nr:flavocytochrome c [Treponema sp.]